MSSDTASRRLLSASALMAAGTMVSRLFGFVRTALIVFILGNATRQVDMFTLANTVPNSLYILIAGGALNAVLVPQIVRAIKYDDDGGEAYTNRIMTVTLAIIGVITVLLTIAAPVVMWIWSGAAWRDPSLAAHYQSMVMLAYYCLPQVFFYGAYVIIGQILNAHDKFGPYMWAPIANNVVSIGMLLTYLWLWGTSDGSAPFTGPQQAVLGLGSTLGIAVQALVLLPVLRQIGFRFQPRWDVRGSGLGHTFALAKWTIAFVIVTQLALIVVNKLATNATAGGEGAGLTVYNNAYLLWMVPHSLITVSLATAMLPSASRLAAEGDFVAVQRESMRTMKLVATVLLPVAAVMGFLAMPITRLLFGNGAGAADARFVGWTLIALVIGLVPFTLHYVATRTFYALEDTRTPFIVQCVISTVNVAAALGLVVPWNRPELVAPALALSYTVAYYIGFGVIFRMLCVRLPKLSFAELVRHLVRLLVAALPAAGAAYGVWTLLSRWASGFLSLLGVLAVAGLVALAVFFAIARILNIDEVATMARTLLRRGAPPQADEDSVRLAHAREIAMEVGHPEAETWIMPAICEPAPIADEYASLTRYSPVNQELFVDDDMPAEVTQPVTEPELPSVHAGQVLGRRYELQSCIETYEGIGTWRAFDQVLSRAVLCHVVNAHDYRAPQLLAAARHGAVATDARFLRVFDVSAATEPNGVSYVVSEYSRSRRLGELLTAGPLDPREAAWVTREVADAVASMHAQGLYHQRLSPRSVLVTDGGQVKIASFVVADVLTGPLTAGDPNAADIADIGRLLYALLVHRWPGSPEFGLAAAPTDDDGHVVAPSSLDPTLPSSLDDVCRRILLGTSTTNRRPLRTAQGIAGALSSLLGTSDASSALESRVHNPPTPPAAAMPLPTPPVPPSRDYAPTPARSEHTSSVPTTQPRKHSRAWLLVLILMAILALLGGLIGVFLNTANAPSPSAAPSATATAAPQPATITTVRTFDPTADGGNGAENDETANRATDGKPDTAWQTVRYFNSPKMAGLKPGVGLVVELDKPVEVRRIRLRLTGEKSSLSIRVPTTDSDKPPLTSQKQWRQIGAVANAGTTADIAIDKPVTTRYLLVYFTSLPSIGNNAYRGAINEIQVNP